MEARRGRKNISSVELALMDPVSQQSICHQEHPKPVSILHKSSRLGEKRSFAFETVAGCDVC